MISKDSVSKKYVEWPEIDDICQTIILRIERLNFQPEIILTPLKGGVIPATIIANKLNVPNLITVVAKRTVDNSIEARRVKVILDRLPEKKEIENRRILIIDEIADSGETLEKVYSMIARLKPKAILTAVLFTNSRRFNMKNRKPDISIKETNKWVVFPWE
jgi:uncharacterized protein